MAYGSTCAASFGVQELDDKVHDTFLIVVQAIRRGDLREPDRLMGFVRTVVERQVAAAIEAERADPPRLSRTWSKAVTVIRYGARPPKRTRHFAASRPRSWKPSCRSLSSRDREVLTRFYLSSSRRSRSAAQMELTDTQFRLLSPGPRRDSAKLGTAQAGPAPSAPTFREKSRRLRRTNQSGDGTTVVHAVALPERTLPCRPGSSTSTEDAWSVFPGDAP